MSRVALVVIIILVVIAIVVGLFLVFMGGGNVNIPGQKTTISPGGTTFKIQGMTVEVLQPGNGKETKVGDTVTVNYKGMLQDGKVFDSSYDRNVPFTFPLKENTVISGFYLGTLGMKVGEKRKLTIPPEMGYGENGFLAIPANSTLIFEVELLGISAAAQ
ncbi:MAG: FKBP-type peptidyl-prolyl cis-trans isomerase [Patescibacteria group bacterium]